MRKQFLIWGIVISIYGLRLLTYPQDDLALKKLVSDSTHKNFVLTVKEEPSSKNGFLTIKAKLTEVCGDLDLPESNQKSVGVSAQESCEKIKSHSFVQTRIFEKTIQAELEKSDHQILEVGDKIIVTGTVHTLIKSGTEVGAEKLSGNLNAEELAKLKKEKSFQNYLRKERIFYEVKIQKIQQLEKPPHFIFVRALIRLRKSIEESIRNSMPSPESDLAQGLVISGKGSMSPELLKDFTRVGLVHIVVLSGSNVSIISAALFAMLKNLPYFLKVSLGIFSMAGFAIMTGGSPPVTRSVLMSSLPLLWRIIKKRSDEQEKIESGEVQEPVKSLTKKLSMYQERDSPLILLFATGMCMSLYNPLLPIYDISFQLSFMATLGLMVLTEPFAKLLSFIPEKFSIREIVSSSLATQVYVLPLLLTISDEVSTVFLVANIIVLPILPLVMLLIGVVSFTRFMIPDVSGVAASVSWFFLHYIIEIVVYLSNLGYATFSLYTLSLTQVGVIYSVVILLTFQANKILQKCNK